MQLLSELMSVDEVDARIEMDVMITNIAVWLIVVLAVAELLIYVQRRVDRIF